MEIGGIHTTERCNLSCSMCLFNGPGAPRKARTLDPELVMKFMREIPSGRELWFAGTGELFMDSHALDYLRHARDLGHRPCVLTNGQLMTPSLIDAMLEAGVRHIRISVDAIDPEHYRRVRRGGNFETILKVCKYLRSKRRTYPGLYVEINNVLFEDTVSRQDEFIRFWKGKVDQINFNAEYYDILKFRNTLYTPPEERVDCELRVYLLASGQMSPCCAINVYQHYRHFDWLPHIETTSPADAYEQFQAMYADPLSPLRQICKDCEWWILWTTNEDGMTPYIRCVPLSDNAFLRSSKNRALRILKRTPLLGRLLGLLKQNFRSFWP